MSFVEILIIAFALAMDAFAVAIGLGLSGRIHRFSSASRLAFSFGFFQFIMPVAGWLLGSNIESLIAPVDHWVAFGLLFIVGARMIKEGMEKRGESDSAGRDDMSILMLSVATSIDAFAVGLGLAVLGMSIWYPCIIIGLVASVMTLIGAKIGHIAGKNLGKSMEIAGGIILILIGLRIVVTHLSKHI